MAKMNANYYGGLANNIASRILTLKSDKIINNYALKTELPIILEILDLFKSLKWLLYKCADKWKVQWALYNKIYELVYIKIYKAVSPAFHCSIMN